MKAISLNIPDELNINTFDISIYLASKLYEDGILSSGQAAMMAGISKRTFIELMGKYGVSIFNNTVEDLQSDIKNA